MFRVIFHSLLIFSCVTDITQAFEIKRIEYNYKLKSDESKSPEVSENSEKIDLYVSNGNIAGRHDFPFKIALLSRKASGEVLCGGSLISNWAVLTAASCLDGASLTTVILGASDLQNRDEPFQARIQVDSSNYRIHPFYRTGITNSDVAIIRFNAPIHVFTRAVNPVLLPTPAMLDEDFANLDTLSMGFGRNSDVAENNSYTLNFVELITMTNTLCRLSVGVIDNSHLCTSGTLGRGLCSGDIGAPLILERNGRNYQIGIASLFPDSGCSTRRPTVFTRVTSFMNFIEQNM